MSAVPIKEVTCSPRWQWVNVRTREMFCHLFQLVQINVAILVAVKHLKGFLQILNKDLQLSDLYYIGLNNNRGYSHQVAPAHCFSSSSSAGTLGNRWFRPR